MKISCYLVGGTLRKLTVTCRSWRGGVEGSLLVSIGVSEGCKVRWTVVLYPRCWRRYRAARYVSTGAVHTISVIRQGHPLIRNTRDNRRLPVGLALCESEDR